MTDPVDLDAYLARIGVPRAGLAADLPSLLHLASRHAAAIPFESLSPFLALPVPLATPLIERKLVHDGRGGYCFEQNRLFAAVLADLGFELSYLIARVTWGQPDDAITPRSHMVLRVELDGVSYITAVFRSQPGAARNFGLASVSGLMVLHIVTMLAIRTRWLTHRYVMPLLYRIVTYGCVQVTYFMFAQLLPLANPRALDLQLYRFDLTPQWLIDYESPNHFTATHPSSRFVNHLIAARSLPDRRLALFDREFAVHALNGATQRRTLADTDGVLAVLRDEFGLRLPVDEAATRLRGRIDALPLLHEQQPDSTP